MVSFDFMDEHSSNTHSSNNCDYDEVAMSESTKTPKLLLNRNEDEESDCYVHQRNFNSAKHAWKDNDAVSMNSFAILSAHRKIVLSDNDSDDLELKTPQKMKQFDLISDTQSALALLEYDNVSMASLGHGMQSSSKKKHNYLS